MRFQVIFFIAILTFTVFLTGCPSNPEPFNANTNSGNSNTIAPKANTNAIAMPTRTPEAATTNNAPTLGPVVAAYYDALRKKDDAGVRKVLSQAHIKQLEEDMREEKQTSLAAYIASIEDLSKPVEVRNEQISGDRATAELKGGTYINWTKFTFIKENGAWKITNEFDDNKVVDQSVTNSKPTK